MRAIAGTQRSAGSGGGVERRQAALRQLAQKTERDISQEFSNHGRVEQRPRGLQRADDGGGSRDGLIAWRDPDTTAVDGDLAAAGQDAGIAQKGVGLRPQDAARHHGGCLQGC